LRPEIEAMTTLNDLNALRATAEAHHAAWRRARGGTELGDRQLRALKLVLLQAAIRSLAVQRERQRQPPAGDVGTGE
jgi:hypothetical protein